MRKIKFRGIDADVRVPVYGDLTHIHTSYGRDLFYISGQLVEHYSVAQLVGLDRNGNEVYEGDTLIDELEQEYVAEIYDRPEKIHALKLKEAPTNA